MSTVNLSFDTDHDINIEHARFCNKVSVTAEIEDVLDHFTVEEVVAHFETADLLNAIGVDEVRDHFDLIENA